MKRDDGTTVDYVWCHLNPDHLALTREEDILPSIRLSYSSFQDVKVEPVPPSLTDRSLFVYRVTWKGGSDTVSFRRFPIIDEVTHL